MAFPTLVGTATNFQANDSSDQQVANMPAGIQVGDLIVTFGGRNGANGTGSIASGWTAMSTLGNGNRGSSMQYRVADGTEGSSMVVRNYTSITTDYVTTTYVFRNWVSIEWTALTSIASSTTPNMPALTPAGGADDYAWLTGAHSNGTVEATAAPTNYTGLLNNNPNSADNSMTFSAHRFLNAASEDPATFTLSSAQVVHAFTIAVRGAAAKPRSFGTIVG